LSARCKDGDVLVRLILVSPLATSIHFSVREREWHKYAIAARHSAPIEGSSKAGPRRGAQEACSDMFRHKDGSQGMKTGHAART
jgi:hypothetical protein